MKKKELYILRSATQVLLDSSHKHYKEYAYIGQIPQDRKVAFFEDGSWLTAKSLAAWWRDWTCNYHIPTQNGDVCYNQPKMLQKTWNGGALYIEPVWIGKYHWLDKEFEKYNQ